MVARVGARTLVIIAIGFTPAYPSTQRRIALQVWTHSLMVPPITTDSRALRHEIDIAFRRPLTRAQMRLHLEPLRYSL
jgi:hypothetical protein